MFLKVLMLIGSQRLKNVLFVTVDMFLDKRVKFQSSVHNGIHNILMMSIDINSILISNIHYGDNCCIIAGISKREAINLFKKI